MLDLNPERQLLDIQLIIKDLLKVVKIVSLYPETNPLPQNMKRSFAEKFETIIDDYGDIKLTVEKDSLSYAGETVFTDKNKDETLISLLFDSGILTITFKAGLDVIEIYRFLEIIKTGINTPGHDYDLVNALWEADLSNISMTTAEDIALAAYDGDLNVQEISLSGRSDKKAEALPEGFQSIFEPQSESDDDRGYEINESDLADFDDSQPIEDGSYSDWSPQDDDAGGTPGRGLSGGRPGQNVRGRMVRGAPGVPGSPSVGARSQPRSPLSIPGANDEEMKTMEAADAMGFNAPASAATVSAAPMPDSTMILNDQFQLSEEEHEEVQKLLDDDAQFDPWESTAELLCELLHQEDEMSAFYETVGVVEKVIGELVQNARLAEADRVLAYINKLREQINNEKPLWSERLRDAVVTTGSKERLATLIYALNHHQEITPNAIKRYLSRFGWESLGAVTDMLADLTHDAHREAVRTHLASLGGKNIQVISRGIYDKRSYVVKSAIQVLTAVSDPAALKHLQKATEHKDIEVRLELARALKDSPLKQTLDLLIKLACDRQSEVRQEAVKIIVERRGQAAFDAITSLINDDEFGLQTHEDRQALLIAYSNLGSEHAVEYLKKLAIQYNPLFGKLIEQLRQESFEALAHNSSDRAGQVLIKLTGSWRSSVKKFAIKAIHKRREIVYGGDDGDSN